MSRKEWGALVVVLSAVLGLQLAANGGGGDPQDEHHSGNAREAPASETPESSAQEGMFRTVTLEVTGMT